jgi:hypothetical protein
MIFRRQLKLLLRDPLGNFDKTTLHDSFQLKEWLPNARRSQTFRPHFAPSTECLYTYHDNGRIYKSLARTRRQFHAHKTLVPHLPPGAVQVTKTTNAAIAGFHGFATETEIPPPDPPQTMADLLADIPEWKQAYLRDLTTSIDIEKILLAALQKGALIVVTDSSARSAGGFAWVLAAYEDPLHFIHGGGYTGPSQFGITSHRMEASGCLGKRLDRSRTTSTIKFLHSWLPTPQQQHEIDEEKDANCQNCTQQHPETEDHIL